MLDTSKCYLFRQGRKSKDGKDTFISYDTFGKVIIAVNCKATGYYTIDNVIKDTKNCYVVEVSEVLYDYYYGMPYEKFKYLLVSRDYKLAYELPFLTRQSKESPITEYQLVAYNDKLNILVLAETFRLYDDVFNTVDFYCYGSNISCIPIRTKFVKILCHDHTVFDITRGSNIVDPIHFVEQFSNSEAIKGSFEIPSTWTYADEDICDRFDEFKIRFLSLIPNELKLWFTNQIK